MSDMQQLARRAVAAKTISDMIKAVGDDAKGDLLGLMAEHGSERVRVTSETGDDFGAVTLVPGRINARIIDPAAFLAWVLERYPEQIIQTVSPAFAERLLATAARKGDPVDDQGEVIPGVMVGQGAGYLTVRPTPAAKDRAADLLANNLPSITATASTTEQESSK